MHSEDEWLAEHRPLARPVDNYQTPVTPSAATRRPRRQQVITEEYYTAGRSLEGRDIVVLIGVVIFLIVLGLALLG